MTALAFRPALTAWGRPIDVDVPAELLPDAEALIARLEHLWDPTLPDSDLHRLFAAIGTVIPVEPETVALIELAARAAWRGPEPAQALHDVVLDRRHGRVGLPEPELLDLRAMAPVLAAALVSRYVQEKNIQA